MLSYSFCLLLTGCHSPKGWPSGHYYSRQICWQEGATSHPFIPASLLCQEIPGLTLLVPPGRHHPTRRHRHKIPPILLRPRRRHRTLPIQSHPPHGQEAHGEAIEGQTIYQDDQLQPPDAHTIHPRTGRIEGSHHQRHIQGGQPERGGEEECEEGARGEIPEWKE